jgi:hypothetical protein
MTRTMARLKKTADGLKGKLKRQAGGGLII